MINNNDQDSPIVNNNNCQDLGLFGYFTLCYSVLFIVAVLVVLSLFFILHFSSIFLFVPCHCVLEHLVFTVVFLVRVSNLYYLSLASRHIIVSFHFSSSRSFPLSTY